LLISVTGAGIHVFSCVLQDGNLVPTSAEFGLSKVDPDWIFGFSALRDPLRQEVRLFFDSYEEPARQIGKVFFLGQMTNSSIEGAHEVSNCSLELISDPAGQSVQKDTRANVEGLQMLEGWQLTCPNPSQHFERALLVYNSTKYASFQIETIHTEKLGKIAACVGPLFTERRLTRPWIFYSKWLGIERINIYHAIVNKETVANPWMSGIFPSTELTQHVPVKLFPHSSVRWYTYEAPPLRYFHGQTTALNDCLVRNRYLYEFLVVSDVDEVIRIVEGPKSDFGALLDQHFPPNTSSLGIPRYIFPLKCCNYHLETGKLNDEASSVQFFESCSVHTKKDHWLGKSVVRPELTEIITQHRTLLPRPGFDPRVILAPEVAHLVHVKGTASWGYSLDCENAHEGFASE